MNLDGKNNVNVSEIDQKSAKVTITSPTEGKKCFYKLFYARLPTLGVENICGKDGATECSYACATPIVIKNLKPSTSYIIQVSVGENASDNNKNVVNTLFTTSNLKIKD